MDKKPFESLDDIRKYVNSNIKMGRDYIIETAAFKDQDLMKVYEAEEKMLPLLVNLESEAAQELLNAVLSKKEPDMEPFLQVLYNTDFDYDEYKYLGENDGMMKEMATMADKLGMSEESKRAYEAIYNMD